MFRKAIIFVLSLMILNIKAQLDLTNSLAGGVAEVVAKGAAESLVGDVPVAGDVVTNIVEEVPIAEGVTSVVPVVGTIGEVANSPTDAVETVASDILEALPIAGGVTSVEPVIETLGTVSGVTSNPIDVVETATDSGIVENVPVAGDVASVGPVLQKLGPVADAPNPTDVVGSVTKSEVKDLPVCEVMDKTGSVRAPARTLTGRDLLKLILQRRLEMLNS